MAYVPTGRPNGRPKGSSGKAKALDCVEALKRIEDLGSREPTRDEIFKMSPIEIMDYAAKWYASKGQWSTAAAIGNNVAPYMFAKIAPKQEQTEDKGDTIKVRVYGGLPDDQKQAEPLDEDERQPDKNFEEERDWSVGIKQTVVDLEDLPAKYQTPSQDEPQGDDKPAQVDEQPKPVNFDDLI